MTDQPKNMNAQGLSSDAGNNSTAPSSDVRLGTMWAALVYALGTMSLAWPALLGKFSVSPHSDQFIAGYPFREFGAAVLKATGSFPQWIPYQFGGMPYIAAMHGDIFYPTFLLRMFMPTDVAMTWGFIIHLFLAGLFTYIFLRKVGFGFWGALIGGMAYMMGGHVASHVSPGHDGKLFVSALFPLLLWAVVAGVRDGRRWAWGTIAIVVGLDVLSPHPQLLQYSLLAAGAYAIFLAANGVKLGIIEKSATIKRLAAALGGVVLGGAIGAIQYMPVRGYINWSPRADGIGSYERATSYGWNPQELLNVYIPEFSGILNNYWGPNGIHLHSEYIGVTVLMLAGAAFIGLRTDTKKREIWFWTITFIVVMLWSLGAHTPFYKIPYHLVPGTKFFRAPATIFFVGALAVSYLVAVGAEKAMSAKIGIRYAMGWLIFGALLAFLGVTGGLTNFAENIAPDHPVLLQRVVDNHDALLIGSIRSFIFVLLTATVFHFAVRPGVKKYVIAGALLLIGTLDLWTNAKKYWIFSGPAAEVYASDPAIEFLKSQDQPARVLALGMGGGAERAKYSGAGLMVHDIRNTMGYHGNQIRWYNDLLGLQNPNEAVMRLLGTPNLRQLTNTQFILTNTPNITEVPGAELAFGPVKDAHGEETYVFRMGPDAPFAWVAPLIIKASDESILGTVIDPRFDVTRAALFSEDADVTEASGVDTLPDPTGINVRVASYAPGDVKLILDRPAPAGAALIASENYYPGWTATSSDGQELRVGRAQFAFIGVELPEGTTEVQLAFKDLSYDTGKMITIVAILISLLLLGWGAATGRGAREVV